MAIDDVTNCRCAACLALLAECGPAHYDFYRRNLLARGWAGTVTPVEKAYQKAHAEWARRVPSHGFVQGAFHLGESRSAGAMKQEATS